MDFLITLVCLVGLGGLIFFALEQISPDEWFKKIARFAVGIAVLIAFLLAVKGVLFGGGLAIAGPVAILECAIGIIVLVIVIRLIFMFLDWLATQWPPIRAFMAAIKYVIGGVAVIAILVLAERALFGGGLGIVPARYFRSALDAVLRA